MMRLQFVFLLMAADAVPNHGLFSAHRRYEVSACLKGLPCIILLLFAESPRQVDRTLALDVATTSEAAYLSGIEIIVCTWFSIG
jgi:hypothetical protein